MTNLIARGNAAFAAGLGIVALVGWILKLPLLASLGRAWIPMAPSTALLFVLFGTTVFSSTRVSLSRTAYWAGIGIGSGGALVGLMLLILSYFGIRLEFEHIGIAIAGTVSGVPIGHMSPAVALCFLLAGCSLVATLTSLPERPGRAMAGFWLASIVVFASMVFLLAYLFGTPLLYGGKFIPPALTTSIALAALGTSLLAFAGPRAWAPNQQIDAATLRASLSFILVFVLMAVGLVIAGGIHFRNSAAQHRADVERQLSAIADLKVSDLVNWRKERFGDATLLHRNALFADQVRRAFADSRDAQAWKHLREWLQQVQETYAYEAIVLMDARGVTRFSVPDGSSAANEPEIARHVLHSGEVILKDFHQDDPGGAPHLSLLVPIPDETEGGRLLGIVMLEIDPTKYLYPSIGRWPTLSPTAETLLVRRDGNEVLYLNELRFQKNTALSLRFPLTRTELPEVKAVLGQQEIVEGTDYRGVPSIAAIRAVPDMPWFLVARMDTAEFMESIDESLWLTASLVGALLLAAGAAVGLIWRHERVRHYKERLRGAEALAAGAARYRAVAQTAADAIVTADSDGKIAGWNAGAERIFGYSDAEALGLPLVRLMPQRYRERHLASFNRVKAGGERHVIGGTVELHGVTKAGTEFPLELSLADWETSEGRFSTGIIRDITERKHAQKALAHQKDLYDMLSQTNQAIVRMTRRDELFPAVCRIAVQYGHFRFAWIGLIDKDGQSVILAAKYGEDAGYVEQLHASAEPKHPTGRGPIGQALRTGKRVVSNDLLSDPATAPWHEAAQRAGVRASAALPICKGGAVVGVIVLSAGESGFFVEDLFPTLDEMALDVSFALDNFEHQAELTRAVEALRESELRYRQLFEVNPHPMWVYDLETLHFLAVNDAAVTHYGYSRGEFDAMTIADIRPAEDVSRLLENVAHVAAGKVDEAGVWRHRKKDGAVIDVEITSHVFEFGGRRAEMVLAHDITERRRAEQAQRESEVRYRSLFENMLNGFAHCRMQYDEHGRPVDFFYLDVNVAFERLTGLKNVVGRRVSEIIPGIRELSPELFETYGRVALTGVPETFEFDFKSLDQWLTISVYSRTKGEFIAVFDDITERKRAQQALTESEARYRSLFENSNVATLLIDPTDGRIVDANVAACAFYGWDLAALKTMTMFEINTLAAAQLKTDIDCLREMKRRFDFRHRLANGEVRDVEVFSGPVEVGGRKLFLSIVHDVTERLRIRRELAESEEQFRGLVEQTIAGIYIIQDGKFAYVNPRLAEILGYDSAGDLIGRDLEFVTEEKDRGIVAENMLLCLEGERTSVSFSFAGVRKDGSLIDIGAQGAHATRGSHPVVIGLMQDISEKKRAEDQVKRHVAQLEAAFMSTVAVATTLSEMRDPYTAGHERKVAEIAVAIGAELGLDERRLEGLRVAGYLHDVGKMTVPAEILAKPGKLSEIEFQLIKGHAQAGYDVLKGVRFPWLVAEVALQHHERMDGSGYPQGLKGDAIVIEARIIAVADVVEAMSSHRPYRPALGLDSALAEIERGRGTAYDADVADACLRLFREKSYAIPA